MKKLKGGSECKIDCIKFNNTNENYEKSFILENVDDFFLAIKRLSNQEEKLVEEQVFSIFFTSIGDILLQENQLKKARESFQWSASIEEKIGNQHGLCKALTDLGNVLLKQGELEEAEKIFQSTHNIFTEVKNLRGQFIAMMGLVRILRQQGKLKEAEERLNESLKISESLDDKKSISFVLIQMVTILREQGRMNEVKEIFAKIRNVAEMPIDDIGNHTDEFVLKKGTVKRTNEKGFGFIKPDDGHQDIFFSFWLVNPECLNSLNMGSRVEYVEYEVRINDRMGLAAIVMRIIYE